MRIPWLLRAFIGTAGVCCCLFSQCGAAKSATYTYSTDATCLGRDCNGETFIEQSIFVGDVLNYTVNFPVVPPDVGSAQIFLAIQRFSFGNPTDLPTGLVFDFSWSLNGTPQPTAQITENTAGVTFFDAGDSLNAVTQIQFAATLDDGLPNQDPPYAIYDIGALVEYSPLPLPATLPLFATGLGAMGLLGRRRKRKASAAMQ
jgi:hypothetical protein